MRITGGLFRSRVIKEPRHIRPTQDKVRKSLFDILRGVISHACFLELFAGSGAVGIDALSNGAKQVIFVENDRRCCKIIEDNLRQLGLLVKESDQRKNIAILATDAFKAIEVLSKENRKFDIVFLDPPYYKELAKKSLQKLVAYDILAPHALVVVEHSKKDLLAEVFSDLKCFKQTRYGDTVLSFYEKEDVAL